MEEVRMEIGPERIVKHMSKTDALALALLYANNHEPIPDDLFFQKEMFLVIDFIEEMKDYADFQAHFFGPYSEPVEDSIKNLVSYKLIEKRFSKYYITKKGIDVFKLLEPRIANDKLLAIDDFKKLLNDMSRNELLVFVYFSFPQYITESAIRNQVEKQRVPSAWSLYKKGKISLEKASKLSGLPIEDLLNKRR